MTFDEAIENLDLKYFEYLNKKENIITGTTPDSVSNHFSIYRVGDKNTLTFKNDTHLPQYIQDEIKLFFQSLDLND